MGGVLIETAKTVWGLNTFPAVAEAGIPSTPIYEIVGLQVLFKYPSKALSETG